MFKIHNKSNEKKPKKSLKKIVVKLGVMQDNHNSSVHLHIWDIKYDNLRFTLEIALLIYLRPFY